MIWGLAVHWCLLRLFLPVFLCLLDTLIHKAHFLFSRGPRGNDSYTQNMAKNTDISALVKTKTLGLVEVKKSQFSSNGNHLRIKSVPKNNVFKEVLQVSTPFLLFYTKPGCTLRATISKYPLLFLAFGNKFLFKPARSPALCEAIFCDCLDGGCQANALLLPSWRISVSCVSALLDKATRENQITSPPTHPRAWVYLTFNSAESRGTHAHKSIAGSFLPHDPRHRAPSNSTIRWDWQAITSITSRKKKPVTKPRIKKFT